jgi:hypothetical protein
MQREVGMDENQARIWQGWHHLMALSLMAMWFLIGKTHWGHQLTLALTLVQVHYGLSVLLMGMFDTPRIDYICRQVHRLLMCNKLTRFYHHCTHKYIPPKKLHRDKQ